VRLCLHEQMEVCVDDVCSFVHPEIICVAVVDVCFVIHVVSMRIVPKCIGIWI
jgi:hypothetical protein